MRLLSSFAASFALAFLLIPAQSHAQALNWEDEFGTHIYATPTRVLISAPGDDERYVANGQGGYDQGAAYVFEADGTGGFQQAAKLIYERDSLDSRGFGNGIIQDDLALILGAGQVNRFVRQPDGAWVQIEPLPLLSSSRPLSIATNGAQVFVVTRSSTTSKATVEVWGRDGFDSRISLRQNITDANPSFGSHIAVDEGTLAVGLDQDGVQIYQRDRNGAWVLQGSALGPTEPGSNSRVTALAVSGRRVFVGRGFDEVSAPRFGAVYELARVPGQNGWAVADTLLPRTVEARYFGLRLAADGERLAVGQDNASTGDDRILLYEPGADGAMQRFASVPLAPFTTSFFQGINTFDLVGGTVLTGSRLDNTRGQNAGAVFRFDEKVDWAQTDAVYADDTGRLPDLVAPWQSADVGYPGIAGFATLDEAADVYSVAGGGDIWGDFDAFHYAYQPARGDIRITAQVLGQSDGNPAAKAGLMVRASLDADAAHGFVAASPRRTLFLQHRPTRGDTTTPSFAVTSRGGEWLRLERRGTQLTAFASSDGGVSWQLFSTAEVALPDEIVVGLAATATDFATDPQLNLVRFSNVRVEALEAEPLPAPWVSADIGHVDVAGATVFSEGAFTVAGSGDVWGNDDGFHYLYQPATGDLSIRARRGAFFTTNTWSKTGFMVRASADSDAAHLFSLVRPNGYVQRRDSTGSAMTSAPFDDPLSFSAPYHRLDRVGDVFTVYRSEDGETWTLAATDTLALPKDVLVGIATTATNLDDENALAAATYTEVVLAKPDDLGAPDEASAATPLNLAIRSAYPNPFREATTLQVTLPDAGRYEIEVFNALGRLVTQATLREDAATVAEVPLDLRGLASGLYLVRVHSPDLGIVATRRLSKLH
ncbi:MAG: T9SS type A sorting domain-containing protein [Bacteroidota bacterium]